MERAIKRGVGIAFKLMITKLTALGSISCSCTILGFFYPPKSKLVPFSSSLVSYVEKKPWWPIQSPNKGRKKTAKGLLEREMRSSLLIFDLRMASCKIQESKKKARCSINCMF